MFKLNAASRIAAADISALRPKEYKEGYAAREAGKRVSEVPYWETISKTRWKLGWHDANAKLDDMK